METIEALIGFVLSGCRDWRMEQSEIDIFDQPQQGRDCDVAYSPKPLYFPPRTRPPVMQLTSSSGTVSSSGTEESVRRAIEAGARLFYLPRVVDGVRILSESVISVTDSEDENESVASEGSQPHRVGSRFLDRSRLTAYNTRQWWKRVIRLG